MAQKEKQNTPVIISKRNNNKVVRKKDTDCQYYHQTQNIQPNQIFKGNIVNGMKFGNSGDMLSGYVQREIVIIDREGNKQIARERQFFNSGKSLNVQIGRKRKDLR